MKTTVRRSRRLVKQPPASSAVVRGYTDSTGNPAHNLQLSQRRAQAVVDYLVAHGVSSSQLRSEGFGADNPVASNATAAGRAQNRRVTIEFNAPVAQ